MALSLDDGSTALGRPVRDHLGEHLRAFYHELIGDSLPADLAKLVRRLERAIQARNEAADPAFVAELIKAVPHLRAFAISRARNVAHAEDLVQETILKAWDKRANFEPGTDLNAWLFTILRNHLYSEHRKSVKEIEDADGTYAASLVARPDQFDRLELQDFAVALDRLRPDQREVLLMVGVQGMTYEEAATVLGIASGTVKSRFSRGRARLAELLDLDAEDAEGDRPSHE